MPAKVKWPQKGVLPRKVNEADGRMMLMIQPFVQQLVRVGKSEGNKERKIRANLPGQRDVSSVDVTHPTSLLFPSVAEVLLCVLVVVIKLF